MGRKENRTSQIEKMRIFFDWLIPNLEHVFSNEKTQSAISQKLASIDSNIRWEVGPLDQHTNFFAFSPNFDIANIPLTIKLAECAPSLDHWVFLPSKPRKNWTSRAIMIKTDGAFVEYDLNNWLYYLTSFNDGDFFDINLVPCGYENKPIDELEYVGSLFCEFELGEKLFIELVDRVNIILPSQLEFFGNKVENLYEQLLSERT
jgi:hypothetical protein